MALFKRNRIWWLDIEIDGKRYRESTKLTNKEAAMEIERARYTKLAKARGGVAERPRLMLFSVAAEKFLLAKKSDWAEHTHVIETFNVRHLNESFENYLLTDITADAVIAHRERRAAEKASPKTVSNELGCLRAILKFHDHDETWRAISKRVKLAKAKKVGYCLTPAEETKLIACCRESRSRSILPAVVMALEACMRRDEVRTLRWRNVDLQQRTITVGESKTAAGEGRVVPMSDLLYSTLAAWAAQFQNRKLSDAVFPSEKYGQPKNGKQGELTIYALDVTRPIGTFKNAWQDVRERAGVDARFHDLRHTGISRLLNSGTSHMVVAQIAGWSTSTAIRMMREVYGHISLDACQRAFEQRDAYRAQQQERERLINESGSQNRHVSAPSASTTIQ